MITNTDCISKLQKVKHDSWTATDTKEEYLKLFSAVSTYCNICAIAEVALGMMASVLLALAQQFLGRLVQKSWSNQSWKTQKNLELCPKLILVTRQFYN